LKILIIIIEMNAQKRLIAGLSWSLGQLH
jgi:hypothetical protein